MNSHISKIRNFLNTHRFLKFFILVFILIFGLQGFIHNHSDDPFHIVHHDECPVTVLSLTSGITLLPITVLFALLATAISVLLYQLLLSSLYQQFPKSLRAPPVVLL